MRPIVVFTDLDGTLLDHETYSYSEALPALSMLKEKSIDLVLASSKTAAEIAPLRSALDFDHCPAIVENGAGILAPNKGADGDGAQYEELRQSIDRIDPTLRRLFRGFGDLTVDGVVAATGLSQEAANRAKQRQFSEPGTFAGSEQQRAAFVSEAQALGLNAKLGGRFLTFSFGGDKAERLEEIVGSINPKPVSVALGDAPNDKAMIEAADYGVVIANPSHAGIPTLDGEATGAIIRSAEIGPKGWNSAVLQLVSTLSDVEA